MSLRYYDLLHKVHTALYKMNKDEANGANNVLDILNNYLYDLHFEQQKEIDARALVKSIEEMWEVSCDVFSHLNPKAFNERTTTYVMQSGSDSESESDSEIESEKNNIE